MSGAAALAREGGVEGEGHEAARGQLLRVEPRGLLLDGAEGSADGHGRITLRSVVALGQVEVARQLGAEAVLEPHALHIDRGVDLEDARVVGQPIDRRCWPLFLFRFLPIGHAAGVQRAEQRQGDDQVSSHAFHFLVLVIRISRFFDCCIHT